MLAAGFIVASTFFTFNVLSFVFGAVSAVLILALTFTVVPKISLKAAARKAAKKTAAVQPTVVAPAVAPVAVAPVALNVEPDLKTATSDQATEIGI